MTTFEKRLIDFVEGNIFPQQNDLVNDCVSNEMFSWDDVSNSHEYFDHNDNELSANEVEKAKEKDDFYDLYYSQEKDIYTWYPISEYLARKLSAKNEPILSNSYGTWWGRTTFGQLIRQDGVIQEIVKEGM